MERNGSLLRDWSHFDAIVAAARLHGVTLLPMVAYTPGWASGGGSAFSFPRRPSDFENFMTAALQRYPSIPAWEIWNEPNLSAFAQPRPDVGRFVALLRAASRARARAGSRAKLVSGGLSPGGEIPIPTFLDEMGRFGGFSLVDGVGIHPYHHLWPDHRRAWFVRLPDIHARISRLAGRDVPIWVTEFGVPTTNRDTLYGPGWGEPEQALRLGRAFALGALWPWLHNLTWYGYRDDCGNPSDPNCRFGLVHEDFSPKRAYGEMRAVAAGRLPLLPSRTTLAARPRGRRLRVSGTLRRPGSDQVDGVVRVAIRRRTGGRRALRRSRTAAVQAGRFRFRLRAPRHSRWRLVARYPGSSRYAASRSRTVRPRRG